MADITIFPYISSPGGIEVCFSVNGGAIQQRHFPPGTSRAAIIAELDGHPVPKVDVKGVVAAREAEAKALRAETSQPATTTGEDEIRRQDSDKDRRIAELNIMRSALKEAGIKGYQLLKEPALRQKYAELRGKDAAEKEE